MKKLLDYPFDPMLIIRKKRSLRRELSGGEGLTEKRIAVLGGSTTDEIKDILELFLLKDGIMPVFYQSEYGRYYEDLMFDNPELDGFGPEVIFIHTTTANISRFPDVCDGEEEVAGLAGSEFDRFRGLWERAADRFGALVIQNNFEPPAFRLFGNLDATDIRGRVRFVNRLNGMFAEYASRKGRPFINDISYLSGWLGLREWHDPHLWYTSKYALSYRAIPYLAHSVASIIRAAYGKSRKCLALDLDNTLWGGVIGDDGPEGIRIGREVAESEAYHDFQSYVRDLGRRGMILAVCSKNDDVNAREGFAHPDSVLKIGDFAAFKANWDPKHENVDEIARGLNIGLESVVFVDDNPAEREIVSAQLPEVAVPDVGPDIALYRGILDRSGLFETVSLSEDDLKRACFYADNLRREGESARFGTYEDFLRSLGMKARIGRFDGVSMERITQLTNKTNQFNLTTRRYAREELEAAASDDANVALYVRLVDKFGDNGIISVLLGRADGAALHIDLWLMSCRVLKRGVELSLMDALVHEASERGLKTIYGYYYRTAKNDMVSGHYEGLGFARVRELDGGGSEWRFDVPEGYAPMNSLIEVER